jgi:hypothetical protein
MILHDVKQGTPAWLAARAGIPTASCFEQIITPEGKPSGQAERYLHRLLAERIMAHPCIDHVSYWQGRGSAMEAEAVSYYEGLRELDTVVVGFVSNDERTIGASPDRLVGDAGLLEIKVPAEHTHVSYLLGRGLDTKYRPQAQGQLWVTRRAWLDLLSYHPDMPPALIRAERDEDYIAKLSRAVTAFSGELERMAEEAKEKGWIK